MRIQHKIIMNLRKEKKRRWGDLSDHLMSKNLVFIQNFNGDSVLGIDISGEFDLGKSAFS